MIAHIGYLFAIIIASITFLFWRRKRVKYYKGELTQTKYLIAYFAEPYALVVWIIGALLIFFTSSSSFHLFYIIPITYLITSSFFVRRAMQTRKRILQQRKQKQKEIH